MDLLGFLGSAKQALSYLHSKSGSDAIWLSDPVEFERHFGAPMDTFFEIVNHLSSDQRQLLEATMDVNPEAAILWILAMEEVNG